MYSRHITPKLLAALADTPVVFLNGARQVGKSTLTKEIAQHSWPATYYTLDNMTTLASVQLDPVGFIKKHSGSIIIDEVQRAPELLISIKEAVDHIRQAGQFLLTGSADVMLLPRVGESLAGRMEILTLWPLSQGELRKHEETFIAALFAQEIPPIKVEKIDREFLFNAIIQGGYPEMLTRSAPQRREEWFNAYLTAILQRDVRELANIADLTIFPKLFSLLATRAASLLNYAELSRASGIAHTTLLRYMALLQTTFLLHTVLPWSNNLSKRLVKAPKIYLCDTGLLAHLLGIDSVRLNLEPHFTGALLENFVVMELKKQLGWSAINAQLFHYRTQSGAEVDIVLENRAGLCVGVEVKASSSVTQRDFKGLTAFAEHIGNKFFRGVILYLGDQILPFGKNLYALPISALWS